MMRLSDLRTLGHSGLAVSPFALGTMTFGNAAWGSSDEVSKQIFDTYFEAGGNFVDTADVYSGGRSEELLGQFIEERKLRDRVILATKYGFNFDTGGNSHATPNPLAGGSGRKNMFRAIDGSLSRLKTDYIDLYWMHVWDGLTPAEEIVGAMGDLIRAGKIRYYGLSDVPAWFATRVATLAQAHGAPAPIALQMFYSLVERSVEKEHIPAARSLGMSMVPWSPLAYGLLTGKYSKEDPKKAESRLSGPNPFGDSLFTDSNWRAVDALREITIELNLPMSRVALAWLQSKSGVGSILLGARTLQQLEDNLASLEVGLDSKIVARLDAASAFDPGLYALSTPGSPLASNALFAGSTVRSYVG